MIKTVSLIISLILMKQTYLPNGLKQVLIVCFFAVALAAPGSRSGSPEEILSYDVEDHKHSQTGDAGSAVKGSYRYGNSTSFTKNCFYVPEIKLQSIID